MALTEFRKQLLRLADGTRTLDEIADAVVGYSHHRDGPGRPDNSLVRSTLSQLRREYPHLAWLTPKKSIRKRPCDKVLVDHLRDWKHGKVSQYELAKKYGVSHATVSRWFETYERHLRNGRQRRV